MKSLLCIPLLLLLLTSCSDEGGDFDKGMAAYESGDYATALRELAPLAEQGDADAQYNLGWMYDNSEGIPQDYKIAVKWYRLAAQQGDVSAQYNLAVNYLYGQGVPQDYTYAYMWGDIAASNGNETGRVIRDKAAKQMNSVDVSAAKALARECMAKNYKGC